MVSIRERHSKAGETTYAALFRRGGQQKSRTFATAKAADDFKKHADLLGLEAALAALEPQALSGPTVDDLFARWIEWKEGTDVTERTLKDYRRDYANWIGPAFGHRPADGIDELDVQQWVDRIAKKLDPKSVGDRHMILGSMYRFGAAKSRRIVTQNPCEETQLPSKRRKAPKGFTPDQWLRMHEWGRVHEPDADDLLLLLQSTGWRFSEATPLTPAAVEDHGDHDLGVPILFVSVLGVHRRDAADRIVYVDGEGKSHAAIRRVNLPPEAARMMRRRLVGKGPEDLLFTNRHGSQWRSNNFIDREFARILAGAGITKTPGMGPHYLRHSHVAALDRAGVSLAKTQRRIGHESITTTLGVYGGMIDNSLTVEELLRLDAVTATEAARQVVSGEVVRGELTQHP